MRRMRRRIVCIFERTMRMQYMTTAEIREKYLQFFEERG